METNLLRKKLGFKRIAEGNVTEKPSSEATKRYVEQQLENSSKEHTLHKESSRER